jgi:hypothetical protein
MLLLLCAPAATAVLLLLVISMAAIHGSVEYLSDS